jgi:hypothetical protein
MKPFVKRPPVPSARTPVRKPAEQLDHVVPLASRRTRSPSA